MPQVGGDIKFLIPWHWNNRCQAEGRKPTRAAGELLPRPLSSELGLREGCPLLVFFDLKCLLKIQLRIQLRISL